MGRTRPLQLQDPSQALEELVGRHLRLEDGVLRSRLLERRFPRVSHGVTFALPSRNHCVGLAWPHEKERALEDQRAFAGALAGQRARYVMQNPGVPQVLRISAQNAHEYEGYDDVPRCRTPGADGIYTLDAGMLLTAVHSDCPQIVLVGTRSVGILHAGKSQLDCGIVSAYLDTVAADGEDLASVHAFVPPSIRKDSLVYDALCLARAGEWVESGVIKTPRRQPLTLDLQRAIALDLAAYGIGKDRISDARIDTYALGPLQAATGGAIYSTRFANTHGLSGTLGYGMLGVMRS